MKIEIDTDAQTLRQVKEGREEVISLYSDQAFDAISNIWVKVGWNQKHTYTFSWMGRPIIQLPEDVMRMQEVIYDLKPTLIIETGVAHGGSVIFYASLFKAMGRGRVIGVDIEIRPPNRKAIEEHTLSHLITLIEGSSTDPAVIKKIQSHVKPDDQILVILDSDHSRKHVLEELRAYAPFVSPNFYMIATDGVMREVHDVPRGNPSWIKDNPCSAVADFLLENQDFKLEIPEWKFNESTLSQSCTHFPDAFLRRVI